MNRYMPEIEMASWGVRIVIVDMEGNGDMDGKNAWMRIENMDEKRKHGWETETWMGNGNMDEN